MTRYALVIGIQQYDGERISSSDCFRNLSKSAKDAEAIAEILEKYGDFHQPVQRFPSTWNAVRNCDEVADVRVEREALRDTIRDFLAKVGREHAEALIYFSGHGFRTTVADAWGAEEQKGFLISSECQTTTQVSDKGLPLKGLHDLIVGTNFSSLTLLLNCCHSGSVLEESQIKGDLSQLLGSERNYFVAAACRSDEESFEGEGEHSLFATAVIRAFKSPGIVKTGDLRSVLREDLRGSGQTYCPWGSDEITLTYGHAEKTVTARQINYLPKIKGLTPLTESSAASQESFRGYLDSEKLPYYSRSAHLSIDPPPENVSIPDEAGLLSRLGSGGLTGFIITGSGGVGKTRLTLEMGRLALEANWLVFRVKERLKAAGIEQLVEQIDPSQKVLLLIDYVETQQDFAEMVETLNELNEDGEFQFRYVANCRTTYYSSIRDASQHQRIDLSPPDTAADWFKRYRHETVRHILKQGDVSESEEYVDLCRDTPILAVFLAYLRSSGKDGDLAALADEESFGKWLLKRIRLSFQKPDVEQELALLIAQFPLSNVVAESIYGGEYHDLFSKLVNDGWIEKDASSYDLNGDLSWIAIHDVLADQVLTHYLESHPGTVEFFINKLLNFAVQKGCLRSTLYTLQRLIGLSLVSNLDWLKILSRHMLSAPDAWREIRDILLRNSLMPSQQTLSLLDEHETVWAGIETEMSFQSALAAFTREYLSGSGIENDDSTNLILSRWIQKSVLQETRVYPLISWGLRLCPEIVREAAFHWIVTYPRQFQTQYLLGSWIVSGLPIEQQIQAALVKWLNTHELAVEARFVYDAWLDAGGETAVVQAHLTQWLNTHESATEASFVYKSWLDAGGEKAVVQAHLTQWLNTHESDVEAQFVYNAWLDARGEKAIVQTHLTQWLNTHELAAEARFVYKAWLDAGGEKAIVQIHLTQWLNTHESDVETQFIYKAWLDAGGEKAVVQAHLTQWLNTHELALEASFVYNAWLYAGGGREFVQAHLTQWLNTHELDLEARFIYNAWLGCLQK
jgi:peptidyl-tRNA hydrolase